MSIELHVMMLIEAARTPPSLTRRRTKVDFCKIQVSFYKKRAQVRLKCTMAEELALRKGRK